MAPPHLVPDERHAWRPTRAGGSGGAAAAGCAGGGQARHGGARPCPPLPSPAQPSPSGCSSSCSVAMSGCTTADAYTTSAATTRRQLPRCSGASAGGGAPPVQAQAAARRLHAVERGVAVCVCQHLRLIVCQQHAGRAQGAAHSRPTSPMPGAGARGAEGREGSAAGAQCTAAHALNRPAPAPSSSTACPHTRSGWPAR